eukprot:5430702-Amphidinium_carterae.1
MEVKVPESVVQSGEQRLADAKVTKASALLLQFMKTEENPLQLRSLVQNQVKYLRAAGMSETAVLPPLLLQKTLKVLAAKA